MLCDSVRTGEVNVGNVEDQASSEGGKNEFLVRIWLARSALSRAPRELPDPRNNCDAMLAQSIEGRCKAMLITRKSTEDLKTTRA